MYKEACTKNAEKTEPSNQKIRIAKIGGKTIAINSRCFNLFFDYSV